MLTRISWLALVLTAGLAGVPNASWGQDYAPPDTVIPLPLFSNRPAMGGLYTFGEFVFYRINNPLEHQVIATRGILDFDGTITADLNGTRIFPVDGSASFILPGNRVPNTFYGSNRIALSADDAKNPQTYQPGFNIGVGWKFQSGLSLDASWLHLIQSRYSAVASLAPSPQFSPGFLLEETFLYSPVFNFPNDYAGAAQKVALGAPFAAYGIWNGASVEQVEFVQRFDQFDLTGRIPVYQDDCTRVYGLLGTRLVWLWEQFKWRVVSQDFAGQAGPADVAIYTNGTSQRMYGVHLGYGFERRLGDTPVGTFSVAVDVQAAALIDVVKERAKYERGDKATAAHRNRNDYSPVPEAQANANVFWFPIEGVEIRGGYDFMAFFNTVASPNPVDFNFGRLAPDWHHGKTRFIDGFHLGIAFVF